jgi:molybdopterin synthase sulfur carrier subunit
VDLPAPLQRLADVHGEIWLETAEPTLRCVLDALEERYPMLRGTIRDQVTGVRRPFLRFFALEEDISHESPDAALPDAIVSGREALLILGAISGG